MNIEQEIRDIVENKKSVIDNQEKHTDLMIDIGTTLLAFLPVALPVSLSLMAGGFIYSALEKNKNLNETSMPDEWLILVSESDGVSKKGIAYLARKAQKKGFISVKEAITFLEIEKSQEIKKNITRENKITKEGLLKIIEKDKNNSILKKIFSNDQTPLSSVHSNMFKAYQHSKDLSGLISKKINPFKK